MASPIFNNIFSFNQTARAKELSCKTDEGLPDCFDWSSAELTDVFDEESCENELWTPPSKELRHQITAQLEHLLSDENLETDAFLLNHIHKNKLGYVSLKLLTSCKKIQDLTCDWHTVLAAAHNSLHLEVNEAGTKVRRKTPIPNWLYSSPNKQLLAWNFLNTPQVTEMEDQKTSGTEHEEIMDTIRFIFSSYGSIGSIHILFPENEISTEFKCYMYRHPELGRELCAVVEYEFQEEACRAYKALSAEKQRHGEEGIHVALLRSQGTLKQEDHEDESEEEEDEHDLISDWKNKKHFLFREDSVLYSSSESDFAPATPRPNRKVSRSRAQYGSPLAIPQVSSFSSDPYRNPLGSPVGSPLLPRRLFFDSPSTSSLAYPPISSTPTSKCCENLPQDGTGDGDSPLLQCLRNAPLAKEGCLFEPSGVGVQVVRQPLGPDGSKGFYSGMKRESTASTAMSLQHF